MVRLERRGGPPNLEKDFEKMVLNVLGGRTLDAQANLESKKGRFPDFGLFRDIVLIEMKNLQTNQTQRLSDVYNKLALESEKPYFYGRRSVDSLLSTASNRDKILAEMFSKLKRTIERILKSANDQFETYRTRNKKKNTVNVCVILNSYLEEYSPEVIARAIHSKMGSESSEVHRFKSIDCVIYITEKHFTSDANGRIKHGVVIYEGMGVVNHPWKDQFVQRILNSWSIFRTGEIAEKYDDIKNFETLEDIPDKIARYQQWQIDYRRRPYLSRLNFEQVRLIFNRFIVLNSLTFVKGSWAKPSRSETEKNLRTFQNLIEEINRRGIDMRQIALKNLTDSEKQIVFRGIPLELRNILDKDSAI